MFHWLITNSAANIFYNKLVFNFSLLDFSSLRNNQYSVIIYSPSCNHKPAWLSFFLGAWKEQFRWMFTLFFFNYHKNSVHSNQSHLKAYNIFVLPEWEMFSTYQLVFPTHKPTIMASGSEKIHETFYDTFCHFWSYINQHPLWKTATWTSLFVFHESPMRLEQNKGE